MILLGDFNKVNISRLKRNFLLKQIVNFPTRDQNKLDLILTNLNDFYDIPTMLPPIDLSDHVTATIVSLNRSVASVPTP